MTNRRVYLASLVCCGAAAAGCAWGVPRSSTADFYFLLILNFAGLAPIALAGAIWLSLRMSRPAFTLAMAAGVLGGVLGLLCSWFWLFRWIGGYPMIGFLLAPAFTGTLCLLVGSLGLIVGSHIEPRSLPAHLCQRCGYDRSGLDNGACCPECGA